MCTVASRMVAYGYLFVYFVFSFRSAYFCNLSQLICRINKNVLEFLIILSCKVIQHLSKALSFLVSKIAF